MAENSPSYSVLTSFGGISHRGRDGEAARMAFQEAVVRVQQEGTGSVALMAGTQIVERYEPQRSEPRRSLWKRLGFGRTTSARHLAADDERKGEK